VWSLGYRQAQPSTDRIAGRVRPAYPRKRLSSGLGLSAHALRNAPLDTTTEALLDAWVKVRPKGARTLISTLAGEPVKDAYVRQLLPRLSSRAGIAKRVHFDTGRLAITRTLIEGKGAPRFSEPKTKRGRRSVALDEGTVSALREHRERQLDERLAWGVAYQDNGLVFCREDGSPIWPRTFARSFDHHVRDADPPKIRLHDLRHTHATLALQAGLHPKVIQERLGHATIAITLDTYSHAIPAMQEDAASRIAALLDS
jgi:integrase